MNRMSFDDYAKHIYQKHRLAVALAIIKSKPANVATAQYLEELKSRINDKMDDDDVTVCSEDFLIDEDDEMNESVTILKDFDLLNGRNYENGNNCPGNAINENNGKEYAASEKQATQPEDLSQTTYYDSSQNEFTPNMAKDITFYEDNHNLNKNFCIEQSLPKNIVNNGHKSDSKTINSDQNTIIDNKSTNKSNSNTLSNAKTSNSKTTNYEPNPTNTDSTYCDSQKTILYTVHGFTQNYTHCSPSQNNIIIPNKYIYGVNRKKSDVTVKNKKVNEENKDNSNGDMSKLVIYSQNINELSDKTQCFSKRSKTENTFRSKTCKKPNNNEFELSQTMNLLSQSNYDVNVIKGQVNLDNNNNNFNSANDRTMEIIDTINNKHTDDTNNHSLTKYSQSLDEYFEVMQQCKEIDNRNSCPVEINDFEPNPKCANMKTTNETFKYTELIDVFSQNTDFSGSKNEMGTQMETQDINTQINKDVSKANDNNQFLDDKTIKPNPQSSKYNSQLSTVTDKNDSSVQCNKNLEESSIAEDYNSEEVISYKVLEEFNKVKMFINRNNRRMSSDGYSTDSGYRSDSQIRSSNRSALQLSGNWINQSGCCLFNYIMQCPLVVATRDITNEISQVFGQLVDKLHEEEKYPSFLEDLLETVDALLRQVSEGESSGDSEFLKKDENIQRILILNQSIHIQKYSIEKISNMLETFHSKVTEADSTFEFSNIDQIENISYVFHILEILLKKHLKSKDKLSQSSTKLSQDEDKFFKKSSLTEVWRKKWNPNQTVFEGSQEKKCVLKGCSGILNKIVVDCVSSYSLIAYSALKCFNSMQS